MYSVGPSTRATTIRIPRARSQARTSVARRRRRPGRVKIVPRLARIAFGLNRSVRGIGGDEAVDAGAVGAAQDRPEIARLLDRLDDDDERVAPGPRADRGRARAGGATATTPSARSPKASFASAASVTGHEARIGRRRAGRAARRRRSIDSGPAQTNTVSTATPASSARSSSRAPSMRIRPVRSRSRRSRSAAAARTRGLAGLAIRSRGRSSRHRATAPSPSAAPAVGGDGELVDLDRPVRGSGPSASAERLGRAGPARTRGCAPTGRRTPVRRRGAPRTPRAGAGGPSRGATAGRRVRGRSSVDRGRSRRSDGRGAPRARRTAAASSAIQRIGASARPFSSAFRRAQATAARPASTWTTRAPARAAANVLPPVWANRLRTSGRRRPRSRTGRSPPSPRTTASAPIQPRSSASSGPAPGSSRPGPTAPVGARTSGRRPRSVHGVSHPASTASQRPGPRSAPSRSARRPAPRRPGRGAGSRPRLGPVGRGRDAPNRSSRRSVADVEQARSRRRRPSRHRAGTRPSRARPATPREPPAADRRIASHPPASGSGDERRTRPMTVRSTASGWRPRARPRRGRRSSLVAACSSSGASPTRRAHDGPDRGARPGARTGRPASAPRPPRQASAAAETYEVKVATGRARQVPVRRGRQDPVHLQEGHDARRRASATATAPRTGRRSSLTAGDTLKAGDGVTGKLATIKRDDGTDPGDLQRRPALLLRRRHGGRRHERPGRRRHLVRRQSVGRRGSAGTSSVAMAPPNDPAVSSPGGATEPRRTGG